MEKFDNSVTQTEMKALREGIKNKYKEYNSTDRDRFPEFEYNTNRANYEPLRLSFDEEFFVLRGINRTQNSLHIPSNNTLALIFSEDSYVPGRKILNTCRSYAEGKSKLAPQTDVPAITTQPKARKQTTNTSRLILAILILLTGLAIYAIKVRLMSAPSGIVITSPANGNTVPMKLIIEGRVLADNRLSRADTVWIVVRAIRFLEYYVQLPIKVAADGTWKGAIYIGGYNKAHIGIHSQIRAFIKPTKILKAEDVLYSWPEAELSSNAIEVVRGPKEIEE